MYQCLQAKMVIILVLTGVDMIYQLPITACEQTAKDG
jgi:hypothetical protein